jgi:hypothetical protein
LVLGLSQVLFHNAGAVLRLAGAQQTADLFVLAGPGMGVADGAVQ